MTMAQYVESQPGLNASKDRPEIVIYLIHFLQLYLSFPRYMVF